MLLTVKVVEAKCFKKVNKEWPEKWSKKTKWKKNLIRSIWSLKGSTKCT